LVKPSGKAERVPHTAVGKEKDLSLWQVFFYILIYFLHFEGGWTKKLRILLVTFENFVYLCQQITDN
jgi:hypothetical protein